MICICFNFIDSLVKESPACQTSNQAQPSNQLHVKHDALVSTWSGTVSTI
jgi:hypothetical protein